MTTIDAGVSTIDARGIGVNYAGRRRGRGWRAGVGAGLGSGRGAGVGSQSGTGTGAGTGAGSGAGRGAGAKRGHGIRDISLRASAGEIVGVLGPNGAGKSTLLRVLATALPPSAGELSLLGRSALPPDPALRRRIGYAGDAPVHIDALSGRENALLFARAAGLAPGRAAEAVGRLLDRLGLADDADRPAGRYSHGMRRKLLLAEALAHEPAIVLLDEPTLGLDPPSRDALAALLRERADTGATVILATHDTRLAESLCDRVLLLHQGCVAAEGTPTELIRRLAPTTRVVVELRNPPRVPPTVAGARTAAEAPDRLVVEAGAGTAVLPALCEALLAAGAEIASIRVREPGLAEAFLTLTGSDLDPVHR